MKSPSEYEQVSAAERRQRRRMLRAAQRLLAQFPPADHPAVIAALGEPYQRALQAEHDDQIVTELLSDREKRPSDKR